MQALGEGGSRDGAPQFGTGPLPENCVEYMVFLIDSQLDSRKVLGTLDSIRKDALRFVDGLTKDYIWQRDGFNLGSKSRSGLLYLHGTTDFGDSVEDEWLVVYMLRELTKAHKNIWVRVCDSDGEFLLVEAANVAPNWLNPEIDSNRVWIHEGKLILVPLGGADGTSSKNIGLAEAVEVIKTKPDSLIHSTFVESEAFYRLEKYPAQITESIHCSLVTIPRKLAYILHGRPKAVAPAVEAFYLRDSNALKLLSSETTSLEFPPEDLVTVGVRFTKVLFAQLKSQRFTPPLAWAALLQDSEKEAAATKTPKAEKKHSRLEIGMKVTAGFELLAITAHQSRSRVAREVAIVLDDLREDGPEGLPTDAEIRKWKDVDRDDDESWLDIDFDDFEQELQGRRGNAPSASGTKKKGGDTSGFGDASAQADLRKIVSRFEAFLNDENAGIDGAEADEMDVDDDEEGDSEDEDDDSEEEDKAVSFDEEEFGRMMREMMGLPATEAKGKGRAVATQSATKAQVDDDDDSEDEEEIRKMAAQMEAELNAHGALSLDPTPKKPDTEKGKSLKIDQDEEEEEEDDGEVDIDYNLAKNLLESFKSQNGLSGPVGNMMSMLGMSLPRDEDDDRDNDGTHGSSGRQK